MKPHTISLISALLAGCAAIFLMLAHHEAKAALAAGYALLAGLTSLALYLSGRQAHLLEAQAGNPVSVDAASAAKPKSTHEQGRHYSRYTSHSRA